MKRVDCPHITPHWFRHTYISDLINETSLSIPEVSELVGHASLQSTFVYAHASQLERLRGKFGEREV
jgi:integrase